MKSVRRRLLVFACCVMAFSAALAAQPEAAAPLVGGGETIDVEIKVVPFYAVDEDGKPVFDLKQDEVELRIDGQPVPIDAFDAFANPGAAEPGETTAKAAQKPAGRMPPRRHVVLFFDVSFSNLHGFDNGKKFARQILDELPETDLLYLVSHDFVSGLKQRLGPIAATPGGKTKLLAGLKKLKPEAGHLDSHADYGAFTLVDRGARKNGVPSNQNSALDYAVRANSQAQLEGTARSLAESMQALADQFQRINEPKLLVFLSQGIHPTLYWEGSEIALQFATHMTSYQYRGLHSLYQKPLEQLADTGTMSLFVNLDDKGGARTSRNDSSMQHMATASGGLYLGGADPSRVSDRFARSTAAYYEAGFYLGDAAQKVSRAKMEIVVKRPGVRTWSAGSIKARETWRGLSEDARRLFIVDLIDGDAAVQKSRSRVRLAFQNLPGTVLGRTLSGKTVLRYEAGWPQELRGRKIDLYNVMLEPARQPGSPQILRFDRKEGTHLDAAGKMASGELEVEVPKKATFVWGIVAVEPTSGRAWYRRLQLQGKP